MVPSCCCHPRVASTSIMGASAGRQQEGVATLLFKIGAELTAEPACPIPPGDSQAASRARCPSRSGSRAVSVVGASTYGRTLSSPPIGPTSWLGLRSSMLAITVSLPLNGRTLTLVRIFSKPLGLLALAQPAIGHVVFAHGAEWFLSAAICCCHLQLWACCCPCLFPPGLLLPKVKSGKVTDGMSERPEVF